MEKDSNDPSATSAAHDIMAPRLFRMRSVLGGTETMRDAGEELLPRHENESSWQYSERLARSVLYNVTKMTLQSWVGQVFKEPMVADSALDPKISELFTDIDLQGNNLQVFAREWFATGLSLGLAPMLVLFPTAETQPQTLRDDAEAGLRPYWQQLAPENVLHVRTSVQPDGREVITHLRVRAFRVEPNGFLDQVVEQVLVYTSTEVTTYEKRARTKGSKPEWIRGESVQHSLGEVPLVVFYAEKDDTMVGRSALFGLADLNIQHWQSQSDQINCLTVARFPILAGSGVPDDGAAVEVGPRKYLHSEDPGSKWYFVEHSGAALQAGSQDLKDIEARMANYGAEFLKRRPGRETASARVLDSSEATSQIAEVALRFNDALAQALYFTARWMNLPEPKPESLMVTMEDPGEPDDTPQ